MAKAKKTRSRTKTRRVARRKGGAKAGRKRAARPSGASKRVAELEAENRRLRDEVASLREELASRADRRDEGQGEQTPLGL
jgi:hypothetical protein